MKRYFSAILTRAALPAAVTLLIYGCAGSDLQGSSKTKKPPRTLTSAEGSAQAARAVFAVRDIGCAMCHAKVESSIISDFNHDRNELTQHLALASILHTLTEPAHRPQISGDFVVPKVSIKHATGARAVPPAGTCEVGLEHIATLPATAVAVPLAGTLRRCLENYFSFGDSSGKFREVASVEIDPPNDPAEIRSMAVRDGVPLSSGSLAALPSFTAQAAGKPEPATQTGFSAAGGALKITGEVTCDGAHVFDGPVVIDNATIKTGRGCRIYATGSIFVKNKLDIVNTAPADAADVAALQLMSAIYVGFHMEKSLIVGRLNHTAIKNRSYRKGTGTDYLKAVIRDAETAGYAELTKAEAAAATSLSYSRIAASAPIVHSRNQGEFSGSVVAEHYIGRIAALSFKFDPVFERAPFFPELGRKIVTVTE